MATREQTLLGAFAALEGAHFYSSFLPSLMTIRKFAKDEEALQAIRQGEAIATALTVAVGWVLSSLTESRLPIYMALAVAVMMLSVYEYGLKRQIGREANIWPLN